MWSALAALAQASSAMTRGVHGTACMALCPIFAAVLLKSST